jgi:hypothetical protein
MKTGILLGLALLACAFIRVRNGANPARPQRVKWWEKLVGVVAVLLAILVIINPEFLPLGLLGDTAFFDLLVLLLGLQLRMVGTQAWGCVAGIFSRIMRWWTPRLSYLLFLSAVAAIGNMVSAVQKVVHRIVS